MRSNYRTLGELVEPVDVKNTDGAITDLVGLSIDKCFIRSVANTIGTDLSKYKVISKNEFAVSLMQVSRDSKIPVACMKDYETAIMSPAYSIFKVKDENIVLPDYLDMWFKRSEFDREAAFIAVGGVRGSMPWNDFARMEVIVPDITKQREIVNEYEVITNRIALKERINQNLERQMQTLFNEMFGAKIPNVENHNNQLLGELITTIDNRGKTPPLEPRVTENPIIDVKALSGNSRIIDFNNCSKYVSEETYSNWFRCGHPKPKDILISTVGSLAETKMFFGTKGCIAQNVVGLRSKQISAYYLYQYLTTIKNDLAAYNIGSVQPSIKVTHIIKHPIYIPSNKELDRFDMYAKVMTNTIYQNCVESNNLSALRDNLLPELMSGDLNVSALNI